MMALQLSFLLLSTASCNGFIQDSWFQRHVNQARSQKFVSSDRTTSDRPFEFHDDFGDSLTESPGNAVLSSAFSSTNDFILSDAEIRKSLMAAQRKHTSKRDENWRSGHWKVRGFSLDKYNPSPSRSNKSNNNKEVQMNEITSRESDLPTKILPSKLCFGWNNEVVVGRTDGSLCVVRLGNEYLTKFESKYSTTAWGTETPKLVPAEPQTEEQARRQYLGLDVPFEVVHQFCPHRDQPISDVLCVSTETNSLLVTADTTGEIKLWSYRYDGDEADAIPLQTLRAHSDKVVALKTVTLQDVDGTVLLLSASIDGTMALWDLKTGDLTYQCEMDSEITCADVSQDGATMYLGMQDGSIFGYNIRDMILSASQGKDCKIPALKFTAHMNGVTSLSCAGKGNSYRSGGDSSILLTGSNDGVVKQWEIFSQHNNNDGTTSMQHWPRLETQRMQSRAHVFRHGNGPISALASLQNSKFFVSAGGDGTVRVWDPSKGTEFFRLDGFSSISSLCLDRDKLVVDGMEQYVCVHDFTVDATKEMEGTELGW